MNEWKSFAYNVFEKIVLFGSVLLPFCQVCQIASPDCLPISPISFSRLRAEESFSPPRLERNTDLLIDCSECSGFPELKAPQLWCELSACLASLRGLSHCPETHGCKKNQGKYADRLLSVLWGVKATLPPPRLCVLLASMKQEQVNFACKPSKVKSQT